MIPIRRVATRGSTLLSILGLVNTPDAGSLLLGGQGVLRDGRSSVDERGAALVVVTHDHRTLDLVDRIFEMEDGLLRVRSEVALPSFAPHQS